MQYTMVYRYVVLQCALSVFLLTTLIRAQNSSTEATVTEVEPTSSVDDDPAAGNATNTTTTTPTTTTSRPPAGGSGQPNTADVSPTGLPDLTNTSADSSAGNDTSGTTSTPTKVSLCYDCVGCTETNITCLSLTGICFMSFSTLTNLTSRGCQMNETSCENPYPGGISANGVCQYCCTDDLCNNAKLTLSQCQELIGSTAVDGRPTSVLTIVGMLLVSLTAAPSLGRL